MFEKYTEKARRAIFFARYEASQFGSPTIETEHLLLGVLRADRILVNRLLRSPDSVEEIRKEIERSTSVREKISTSVDLPVSNEGKRVLAYTAEEAERLGHKHIDTCHMLLGLLREEKSFAAKLLNDQKVYLSQVREQIHELESARETASTSGTPALRTPISISEFGVDLTQEAAEGNLPPLVGREPELERVIQVLCRLTRNSVLMAGEAGVGKQAIVYGLAQGISQGAISRLNGKTIVSLDLDFIASAAKNRARFQTGLENILVELLRGGGPILFINGLSALARTQELLTIADILKPGLLRGAVQCISTATAAEYAKAVEAAPWLERCFSVVEVKPPTETEAIRVLAGIKERFEKFHGVIYSEEAIESAVFHSSSYFSNRHLPEKALDLMDEAGARVKLQQEKPPDDVLQLQVHLRGIQQNQKAAIANHEFQKAKQYEIELEKKRAELQALQAKYKLTERAAPTVTREDVEQIVAQKTGLSLELLRKSMKKS